MPTYLSNEPLFDRLPPFRPCCHGRLRLKLTASCGRAGPCTKTNSCRGLVLLLIRTGYFRTGPRYLIDVAHVTLLKKHVVPNSFDIAKT